MKGFPASCLQRHLLHFPPGHMLNHQLTTVMVELLILIIVILSASLQGENDYLAYLSPLSTVKAHLRLSPKSDHLHHIYIQPFLRDTRKLKVKQKTKVRERGGRKRGRSTPTSLSCAPFSSALSDTLRRK